MKPEDADSYYSLGTAENNLAVDMAEILPSESADMKEEWRDIEGYEGLYMVSNYGRVVSFQGCNPRIMKLGMTHKGYQCVGLQKEKQHKTCVVHRLVAKAFIPNPDNLPQSQG